MSLHGHTCPDPLILKNSYSWFGQCREQQSVTDVGCILGAMSNRLRERHPGERDNHANNDSPYVYMHVSIHMLVCTARTEACHSTHFICTENQQRPCSLSLGTPKSDVQMPCTQSTGKACKDALKAKPFGPFSLQIPGASFEELGRRAFVKFSSTSKLAFKHSLVETL